MKRTSFYWIAVSAFVALGACSMGNADEQADLAGSSSSSGSSSGMGTGTSTGTGTGSSSTSSGTGGASTGSGTGTGTSTGSGAGGPLAGTLTAGDWDDNLNFDFFVEYRTSFAKTNAVAEINIADRVVIRVVDAEDNPIANADVLVHGANDYLLAPTASDGRLLFFPSHDGGAKDEQLKVTVTAPAGQYGVSPVTIDAPLSKSWTITLPGAASVMPTALDLAFVIDTTGSMVDELSYVQAEVQGIAETIKANFGPIDVHYGLVVYRDVSDAYLVNRYDFTSDLSKLKVSLKNQSAEGGGDFPEAMDAALAEMHKLQWRSGNVARVAFLIADAPPHEAKGPATLSFADEARIAGIKIYPIAASGVDDVAEYYLRQSAQLTMARYLFLTDDSGVGNSHAEPHIPCYQVQLLNVLMNRMIASELAGFRVPAKDSDVIKTVGNPSIQGVCKLSDGSDVKY